MGCVDDKIAFLLWDEGRDSLQFVFGVSYVYKCVTFECE